MPDMDGIEATNILRKTGYTGTIVALTANALVGNEEMFLENSFDGFITKPIDIKKLDDIVNKFVRDRHKEG
jgi:CheY-like chemotaxis protein